MFNPYARVQNIGTPGHCQTVSKKVYTKRYFNKATSVIVANHLMEPNKDNMNQIGHN